jgi:hypothetical protein
VYVRAHGDYCELIGDTLPDLKDLVAESVGQPIRRISRFMQLALIGACRCARGLPLPRETAVYLASSGGDLEISVDVLNHMFREGQSPKPLSFVNTVSNSAAFYVAKCLGLQSRSTFVSSRYTAFESALLLALTDFRLGIADSALIGCVESAALPLTTHRERIEVDATAPVAEASHWIWVTRESSSDALARIVDVVVADSQNDAVDWMKTQTFEPSGTLLSAGQYLRADVFAQLQSQTGLTQSFDYRSGRGYYASQSAAAIPSFIDTRRDASALLHLNSDSLGRLTMIGASK